MSPPAPAIPSPDEVAGACKFAQDRLETSAREGSMHRTTFDDLLQAQVVERVPESDRRLMAACSAARSEALHRARRGETSDASTAVGLALNVAHQATRSPDAALLMASFTMAAKAYVSYRESDPSAARRELTHAVEWDQVLIDGGYAILRLHQAQIAHNFMRLDLHDRHFDSAIQMLDVGLALVEGSAASLAGRRLPAVRRVDAVHAYRCVGGRLGDQLVVELGMAHMKEPGLENLIAQRDIHASCMRDVAVDHQQSHALLGLLRCSSEKSSSVLREGLSLVRSLGHAPGVYAVVCGILARGCEQTGDPEYLRAAQEIEFELRRIPDTSSTKVADRRPDDGERSLA